MRITRLVIPMLMMIGFIECISAFSLVDFLARGEDLDRILAKNRLIDIHEFQRDFHGRPDDGEAYLEDLAARHFGITEQAKQIARDADPILENVAKLNEKETTVPLSQAEIKQREELARELFRKLDRLDGLFLTDFANESARKAVYDLKTVFQELHGIDLGVPRLE